MFRPLGETEENGETGDGRDVYVYLGKPGTDGT